MHTKSHARHALNRELRDDNRRFVRMNTLKILSKLSAMVILWTAVWFFLHGEVYKPFLSNHFPASTAFIIGLVIPFLSLAAFEISFIALIIKTQNVKDYRSFFKIEHLDVKGIWLALGLGIVLQVINVAFLWKFLLEPVRNFIISLGILGDKIGFGSGEIVPLLSTSEAIFLTIFLFVFWWVEVPEELFFRGYVQNKLQDVAGKNTAMFLSALIWDVAHLWGFVNILERFFYGLVYAIVFRLRQNTTPTMITHSIGNRSLLLAVIIPQIWGVTLGAQDASTWLLFLLIYIGLLMLVITCWKILKFDRES